MKKSANTDIKRRLSQIQKWIAEGLRNVDIEKKCIELEYCESLRHAKRLIKEATAKWVEDDDKSILTQRLVKEKELIALKKTLLKKYKGTPAGIMAVARVENQIIKLKGLAAPVKVEMTGKGGGAIEVNNTATIDYSKLPDDVLQAIVAARVKETI